jgi:hypothetical protein
MTSRERPIASPCPPPPPGLAGTAAPARADRRVPLPDVPARGSVGVSAWIVALLFLLGFALAAQPAAAKKRPPAPPPEPGTGSIGISLRGWSPGGANRLEAVIVQFVRAERPGDAYSATTLIPSNHEGRDGRVYLLNVPPGRYAPVAFQTRGGSAFAVRDKQWVFLEKKLIDELTVTVKAGALVFAGDYSLGGTAWRGRAEKLSEKNPYHADAAQVHYLALMFPRAEGKSTLARIYGKNPVYIGTRLDRKSRQGPEAERDFRRLAVEHDFEKAPAWRPLVEPSR